MDTPENAIISQAMMALGLTIGGYYAYYFPAFSAGAVRWFQQKYGPAKGNINLFIFQKVLGFLFLGLIPVLIFFSKYSLFPQKYSLGELSEIRWWIYLVLVSLIFAASFFSSRKQGKNSRVPQMRLSNWGAKETSISLLGWAIFLLGYEFLFRYLLLFTTAAAFGIWPAVLINIGLYSAFHLPNGMAETLASIAFGLVLCLVSLITGSFLAAFLLHLALSASAELFSIRFNPEMNFRFTNSSPRK